MSFEKELVAKKLRRWEKYLDQYSLPEWESIPNFGLYMEQVVILLKEYLDYLPPELQDEQIITPATINNYVRKKIMPEPVKKKYYRIHIAYLIMICSLKQCLSIAMLQVLIPFGLTEEETRMVYTTYSKIHRRSCNYFIKQVKLAAGQILDHDVQDEITMGNTVEMIEGTAIMSGLSRLLAEKLILLEGKTVASTDPSALV